MTAQDRATIQVASEFGQELCDYVIAERDRIMSTVRARARSRASMSRILDAL